MNSKYTMNDIARYAEGLMEGDELRGFEAALTSDKELQEMHQFYLATEATLKQHFAAEEGEEKLKLTLQDMRKEFFSEAATSPVVTMPSSAPVRAKVVKLMWRKLAITAAAAVLVALFLWQPWKQEDLYTKYAGIEMVSPVERGSHADSLMVQATAAFNAKEFSSAAVYLFEVVEAQPDNSLAQFYYGVSLLQSGKTPLARGILTALSKGNSAFKQEATFYVALSYLKENDKENCKKWLQQIPADSGNYDKAKELMQAL